MSMPKRLEKLIAYLLNRAGEASTWQGIGFFATLAGAKWGAELDWGAAAAAGATVSGLIKTLMPDVMKKKGG